MYVFGLGEQGASQCRAEADAAARAGLPAFYTRAAIDELPFKPAGAYGMPDQINFHPRKWLLGLARTIPGGGSYVAEGVLATGLTEAKSADDVHVVTTSRGDVRARHVVVATHYPIYDRGLFFARLTPIRENAIAGLIDADKAPRGGYLAADASLSFRSAPVSVPGKRLLIVVGEKYPTGTDSNTAARFDRLAAWAADTYGLQKVDYRWATQDLVPPDGLPFVGRYHPGAHNLWTAAGFNQWGLTTGTHAGHMLASFVASGSHADADLYSPQRAGQLIKGAPKLIHDQLNVGKHYIGDSCAPLLRMGKPRDLRPGDAMVVNVKGRNVAAYRDKQGALHCFGATCTHLGCTVGFNNLEESHDCPCHGSRFSSIDGRVLHGPATDPLPIIDVEDM